jgi:hypothetical protein
MTRGAAVSVVLSSLVVVHRAAAQVVEPAGFPSGFFETSKPPAPSDPWAGRVRVELFGTQEYASSKDWKTIDGLRFPISIGLGIHASRHWYFSADAGYTLGDVVGPHVSASARYYFSFAAEDSLFARRAPFWVGFESAYRWLRVQESSSEVSLLAVRGREFDFLSPQLGWEMRYRDRGGIGQQMLYVAVPMGVDSLTTADGQPAARQLVISFVWGFAAFWDF